MPYAKVIAASIRAARSYAGLQQEPAAARMRALGFDSWTRQTVATVEGARRRVTAEEIAGLALAYETIPARLLGLLSEDALTAMPSGLAIPVRRLSFNDRSVSWQGDAPLLAAPSGREEAARRSAADLARFAESAREGGADMGLDIEPGELSAPAG